MSEIGRPSKVSAELGKKIANLLLQGITEKEAAMACGLDPASFFSFMKQGAAGVPEYAQFRQIVEAAKLQRKTWKKPAR